MSAEQINDAVDADTEADAGEPDELAAADAPVGEAYRDELPEDLQPDLVDVAEYIFPNNNRRRVPAILYGLIALGLVGLALWRGTDAVLVNSGMYAAALILVVVGAYSWVSGYDTAVDEQDALVAAIKHIGFPVGHASAQMGWRGLLSRPMWKILLYSAEEPPQQRGFVMVDAVDGSILEELIESNPEDWSDVAAASR